MKCRTYKCKARCCYNVPFENGELEKYADKIVNFVVGTIPVLGAVMPITAKIHNNNKYPFLMEENKCPFLRADYKCNIYENRPDICRSFGEIVALKCKDRKQ